ncbi:MAG: hypothetical protein AAGI25_14265, partial [Bacteroidota bacterium]
MKNKPIFVLRHGIGSQYGSTNFKENTIQRISYEKRNSTEYYNISEFGNSSTCCTNTLLIFSKFYNLAGGRRLRRSHYFSKWEGSDISHDPSEYIILSGEYKGEVYNYVRNYTFGKDCDDLDPTLKIESSADWFYDYDQDGYYDGSTGSQFSTCDLSDFKWKRAEDALGTDCDDNDPSKKRNRYWYFFGDDDDYYGEQVWSCGNPGLGTDLEDRWLTDYRNGLDCDDTDSQVYTNREWYYDNDDDNYYGETTISCNNPGKDDSEKLKWKTTKGFDVDCNDEDPNVGNDYVAVYLDLDQDGYHSVIKEEDCGSSLFSETLLANFDIYEDILMDSRELVTIGYTTIASITIENTGETITYT